MQKESKKILITGASRGIGKDIALKSKEKGHEVLGTSTTNEGVSSLKENGIHGLQLDLNDKKSVESFNDLLIKEHPDIAVLVNNAGITRDGLFMWMPPKDWHDVINTSMNGFFNVTNHLIQKILRNKYGRIVNLVSVSGVKGTAGQTNYSAAKGAVVAATKALAQEVAKRNITVNAVAPGFIKSDMTAELDEKELKKMIPANRFGEAEEVADLVAFLVSKKASYITGEIININGGIYS